MQAFIDLITPVLNMPLTVIGGVTITMGYIAGGSLLIGLAFAAGSWLLGRR